jgi:tape measure domain-containing protein
MGIELGKAWIRVRGDSSGLKNDLTNAKGETEKAVGQMSATVGSLVAPFLAAAASLTTLRRALMASGQFEQTTIAFDTMLGSAEETRKTLASLTDFAAKTPFEMPEILQAARGLIQFGERGDDLMRTLNMLGNAASGTSTPFGFLALVFNQVRGVGKLLTQDFRQLSTRGILSLQDIAKYYKVTTQEAQKMLSAGKISFEDLKKIIESLSMAGGRFANLMEKQSKSLLGLWSTWKDALGIMTRYLGDTVAPAAKNVLTIMIRWGEVIRAFIGDHAELVKNLFIAITVVTSLGIAIKGLSIAAAIAGTTIKGLIAAATIGTGGWLAVVGLVALAVAGLSWWWGEIGKGTSDASKELDDYNTKMDEAIERRKKLEAEGKKKPEEKEQEIVTKTALDDYNAALERRNKATEESIKLDQQSRATRAQQGAVYAEFSPAVQEANKKKIEDIQKLQAVIRYLKTTRKGRIAGGEQADSVEMTALQRSIEWRKEKVQGMLQELPVARQLIDAVNAEAVAIEKRNKARAEAPEKEATKQQQLILEYQKKYQRELEWMRQRQWEESDQFRRLNILSPVFGQEDPMGEAKKWIYEITETPARQFQELVMKINACTKAGLGFADAGRIIKEAWEKTPMYEPTKQLDELKQKLWDIQNKTTEAQKATREFAKNPYATQQQIAEYASISAQLENVDKLKKQKPSSLMEAGRFGFSDFFNQFQDALLKKEDPQKRLVEQGKESFKVLSSIERNTRISVGALK